MTFLNFCAKHFIPFALVRSFGLWLADLKNNRLPEKNGKDYGENIVSFNEFCNLYSINKVEKRQLRRWLGTTAYQRLTKDEWMALWEQYHGDHEQV